MLATAGAGAARRPPRARHAGRSGAAAPAKPAWRGGTRQRTVLRVQLRSRKGPRWLEVAKKKVCSLSQRGTTATRLAAGGSSSAHSTRAAWPDQTGTASRRTGVVTSSEPLADEPVTGAATHRARVQRVHLCTAWRTASVRPRNGAVYRKAARAPERCCTRRLLRPSHQQCSLLTSHNPRN